MTNSTPLKGDELPKKEDDINEVAIEIPPKVIQERAFTLFQANKSREEYMQELARVEAQLRPAVVLPSPQSSKNISLLPLQHVVKIRPKFVMKNPPEREVSQILQTISQMPIKNQDMHWFIAEREYLLDSLKSQLK